MSLDLISCMRSFEAVAKYNGFSAAARKLHLSTPALTKQMQRLENEVGVKLLDRTTRSVSLTEAGNTYLIRVKKILEDITEAKSAIHNIEPEPHGHIIIGLPGIFNTNPFIKILKKFLNKYPKISMETTDDTSPNSILNGSVDLMVSEVDNKDPQFNKDFLFTIRRGVYAAPSYIKKYGIPKNIADLKNHNCLIFKQVSPNDEWIFSKNKKIKVSGNFSSASGMNIKYAGIAGMGLTWITALVVDDEIKAGKLVEIKLDSTPITLDVFLYYKPVFQNSKVRLLADYLQESTKIFRAKRT